MCTIWLFTVDSCFIILAEGYNNYMGWLSIKQVLLTSVNIINAHANHLNCSFKMVVIVHAAGSNN